MSSKNSIAKYVCKNGKTHTLLKSSNIHLNIQIEAFFKGIYEDGITLKNMRDFTWYFNILVKAKTIEANGYKKMTSCKEFVDNKGLYLYIANLLKRWLNEMESTGTYNLGVN